MSWIVAIALTVLLFKLTQAVYAAAPARLGSRFGASVESICVGRGPTLLVTSWNGIRIEIRLLPFGASTQFWSADHSSPDEGAITTSKLRYTDLTVSQRMIILLSGPLTTLMIGAICISIPVWTGGSQLIVDEQLPSAWPISAVRGLTATTEASTFNGQINLFRRTFVAFCYRTMTWRIPRNWGGLFGWFHTCASCALHSSAAWLSSFGIVLFGMGAWNLLPIPPLNGGYLGFLGIEGLAGRLPDKVSTNISLVGMCLCLSFLLMVFYADVLWFLHLSFPRN